MKRGIELSYELTVLALASLDYVLLEDRDFAYLFVSIVKYSSWHTLDAVAETTLFVLHTTSSSWAKVEKHFWASLGVKLEAYD